MGLKEGTKLGPYQLLSPLGAGGMGEVYRAKDTRLNREVAVKVLPSHLTANIEFKQRFEREAKSISQLSHPNICTLHDIGHENGTEFLVMENFSRANRSLSGLEGGASPSTMSSASASRLRLP